MRLTTDLPSSDTPSLAAETRALKRLNASLAANSENQMFKSTFPSFHIFVVEGTALFSFLSCSDQSPEMRPIKSFLIASSTFTSSVKERTSY